jgi:hypothetical protein
MPVAGDPTITAAAQNPGRDALLRGAGQASSIASRSTDSILSKVDEIGWTQLMPGSGHGAGGFVAVSKFEVWGKPVPRMATSSR